MIRYNKSVNKEIQRVVRNYNSKISRLEKLNNDLILPERASVKEIKKTIKSRKDLNRTLNELRLYSKRGVENTIQLDTGLKVSQYEKKIFNRRLGTSKRNINYQIKKYQSQFNNFDEAGKGWARTEYQILVGKRKTLYDSSIEKVYSRDRLESKLRNLKNINHDNQFSNEILKQNFLDKLEYSANLYKFDKEKILRIKEKINSLSDDDFYKLFKDDYSQLSDVMEFNFSPKEIASRGKNAVKEINSYKDKNKELIDYLDENLDRFIKNL